MLDISKLRLTQPKVELELELSLAIPKIVAYLSCSAGRKHFALTKINFPWGMLDSIKLVLTVREDLISPCHSDLFSSQCPPAVCMASSNKQSLATKSLHIFIPTPIMYFYQFNEFSHMLIFTFLC